MIDKTLTLTLTLTLNERALQMLITTVQSYVLDIAAYIEHCPSPADSKKELRAARAQLKEYRALLRRLKKLDAEDPQ